MLAVRGARREETRCDQWRESCPSGPIPVFVAGAWVSERERRGRSEPLETREVIVELGPHPRHVVVSEVVVGCLARGVAWVVDGVAP